MSEDRDARLTIRGRDLPSRSASEPQFIPALPEEHPRVRGVGRIRADITEASGW